MSRRYAFDHFGRRIAYDQEPEPDDSGTLFKAITHLFEKCDPATRREVLETLQNMAEEQSPQEQAEVAEDARRRRARDARTRRLGMDATSSSSFDRMFPSAKRINVLPSESTHGR